MICLVGIFAMGYKKDIIMRNPPLTKVNKNLHSNNINYLSMVSRVKPCPVSHLLRHVPPQRLNFLRRQSQAQPGSPPQDILRRSRKLMGDQPVNLPLCQVPAEPLAKISRLRRTVQHPRCIDAVGPHQPPRPAVVEEGELVSQ